MIENKESVENLEDLMNLSFVDAFFIGPYDLSASLKVTGNFKSKIYLDTIKYIKSISKKYKKPIGIHLIDPNIKELKKLSQEGYKFIAYSLDTVFLSKNSKFKF